MNHDDFSISRRRLIQAMLALGVSGPVMSGLLQAASQNRIQKAVPKSGEQIPVIGVGTSRTFDVLHDEQWMQQLKPVLQTFFDHQGTLIDSSPMYGTAQAVIGQLLKQVKAGDRLFAATKVWINGRQDGIEQMERSRQL